MVGSAFSLPELLVIGAMRAGTTSLFRYLSQHPSLDRGLRKEIDYFTYFYDRGPRWYRAHFAPRWASTKSFEACPYYLFHPLAPQRVAELLPHARIVVLLRDPIDRAFSHWRHLSRVGVETLPFDEAIAAEAERLRGSEELLRTGRTLRVRDHERFSYMARGRYAAQLERWLEYFPAESIRVFQFDDLVAKTQTVLDEVCRHAGVPTFVPDDLRNFSEVGRSAEYRESAHAGAEGPSAELRARLEGELAAEGAKLRALLEANPILTPPIP